MTITACRWCGQTHEATATSIQLCPYVKALEFDPPGSDSIRRVEFMTPADYLPTPKSDGGSSVDYPRLGSKT